MRDAKRAKMEPGFTGSDSATSFPATRLSTQRRTLAAPGSRKCGVKISSRPSEERASLIQCFDSIVFRLVAKMAGRTKSKKPGPPKTAEQLLDEAQELIYDAWEMVDRRDAIARAWKALRISPDCADAYVILAESAMEPDRALELYGKGVAAGERALGKESFERDVGHFWGMLKTRPYMRARAGLAQALWDHGDYDEAIGHWRDMLRLNPADNQGIRYILAARLLYLDRDRETAAVLHQYRGDTAAVVIWIEALLLFRARGDDPKARRALDIALKCNPHVPAYLFFQKPLPRALPEYAGWGDENEAQWCAAENLKAWRTTKGAIAWLAARISAGRPVLLH